MSNTATKLRKNSYELTDVNVQCVATDKGYFGGKIIIEGEKFMYKGVLKDGKFPLWCEPVEEFKASAKKVAKKVTKKAPAKKVDSLV